MQSEDTASQVVTELLAVQLQQHLAKAAGTVAGQPKSRVLVFSH